VPSVHQYLTPRDETLSPQSFNSTLSPTLSSNLSMELLSSPFYSPPASPFIHAVTRRGSAELPTDGSAQRSNTLGGIISSPGVIENPLPLVPVQTQKFSLCCHKYPVTQTPMKGTMTVPPCWGARCPVGRVMLLMVRILHTHVTQSSRSHTFLVTPSTPKSSRRTQLFAFTSHDCSCS
jgi:hypothetical protein